jgi:CPA2 family monovalent cation:H+ antiporter-2
VRLRCRRWSATSLAGVLIGPATPGFVADVALASQLAEIGVMLLMFGVGLHFSLDDLLAVRKIAVPGAIVQIAVRHRAGHGRWRTGGAGAWAPPGVRPGAVGGQHGGAAARAGGRGLLDSFNGRIAVGWLVVEDLAMVLVLVLLPALAGSGAARRRRRAALWRTSAHAAAGGRLRRLDAGGRPQAVPVVAVAGAETGSRELFTLCVVAAAVSIAYGATQAVRRLVRAGRLLRRHGAARVRVQPPRRRGDAAAARRLRGAVLRLGRHAVRPAVLVEQPLQVLAVVGGHRVGKSLAAACWCWLLRYPLNTALTVSASLAQIGEFSFILVGAGHVAGPAAARGPEPGGGRRHHLDRAQPAGVQGGRAAAALAAAARTWRAG